MIKSKYMKDPKKAKNDIFSVDFLNEVPKPATVTQKSDKAKILTTQQQKLIGRTAANDELADDMMTAF